MKHLFGFVFPAAASYTASSLAHDVVVAAVTGIFGVIGVTLAAYVSSELKHKRHERSEHERRR